MSGSKSGPSFNKTDMKGEEEKQHLKTNMLLNKMLFYIIDITKLSNSAFAVVTISMSRKLGPLNLHSGSLYIIQDSQKLFLRLGDGREAHHHTSEVPCVRHILLYSVCNGSY